MDALEKAKELAQVIMEDDRCKRLQVAKAANDSDENLQELIGEFNLKKMMLGQEMKKQPPDKEKSIQYQNELKDIYQKIMENPSMAEYTVAKNEMDQLLMHINQIIQMSVNGDVGSEGCAGNCEGCGGCH